MNKQGFGSQLIAACTKALSGGMQSEFSGNGFACSLTFPVTSLRRAA
jgi:two-component sensor histidine kinase